MSCSFIANSTTLQDFDDNNSTHHFNTTQKAPILIHPNHISLLSPEPTPRRIVQLCLPQRPLRAPYFLAAARPQGRTTRSTAANNTNKPNFRHDSAVSNIEQWASNVRENVHGQRYLAKKQGWMHGMDEAEIMAVEGLMKMRRDVRGVGLRQQQFMRRAG